MLITIFIISLAVGIGFAIIQFLSRFHSTHMPGFLPTQTSPFFIVFGIVGLLAKVFTGNYIAVGIALISGVMVLGVRYLRPRTNNATIPAASKSQQKGW